MPKQVFCYKYLITSIMKKMDDKPSGIGRIVTRYKYRLRYSDPLTIFYSIHDNIRFHSGLPCRWYREAASLSSTAFTWVQVASLG